MKLVKSNIVDWNQISGISVLEGADVPKFDPAHACAECDAEIKGPGDEYSWTNVNGGICKKCHYNHMLKEHPGM